MICRFLCSLIVGVVSRLYFTDISPLSHKILFSRKTSLKLVDNLLQGHDEPIIELRKKVEDIWMEPSPRLRRTMASQSGAGGISLFADNVGKVNIFVLCVL